MIYETQRKPYSVINMSIETTYRNSEQCLNEEHTTDRVCVFLMFDRDGKVDEYVEYYLDKLVPFLNRLVIVANGKLRKEEQEKLRKYAMPNDIIVRENLGYDVGGYLAGIRHIGFSRLSGFDELLLANDSVYGPVYPFEELFSEMDNRKDIDFWGVTGHREFKDVVLEYNPEKHMLAHVQSYFLVLRKAILQDPCFEEYWTRLPLFRTREMAIQRHETYFTFYLEQKGFRWDTYFPVAMEENTLPDSIKSDSLRLLKMRCPFVKRSVFATDPRRFHDTAGENGVTVRKYLERNTDYDFNLILRHLIRTVPLCDLMAGLNLYRVFPHECTYDPQPSTLKSVAVVHVYYEELLDEMTEYMQNIPEETDVFITTPDIDPEIIRKKTRHLKNKIEIRTIENRGRIATAYLVELREVLKGYDVAFLFHDKKTPNAEYRNNAESFFYKLAENTIPSKSFARNVIRQFENDPYLGVMMPTIPTHGTFYFTLGIEWGVNDIDYAKTMELLCRLGIDPVCADNHTAVAPFGDIYWFRVDALMTLLEYPWKTTDFPAEPCPPDGTILHALERSTCFIAQNRGYYSAYLFNDSYFGLEHAMLSSYLRKWNTLSLKAGVSGRESEAITQIAEKLKIDFDTNTDDAIVSIWLPFPTRIRLHMKFSLPKRLYCFIVKAKRFFLGPHGKIFSYEGEIWEQEIRSIRDLRAITSADGTVKYSKKSVSNGAGITDTERNAIQHYNRIAYRAPAEVNSKVSVIIPCYNHERFIEQRIRSIIEQTYPIHEIILLDDASTDRSVDIARRCLEHAACNVRMIQNETNSSNVFAQWKKGLELATGDYIWIAESDDYCRPDFLKTALLPFADEKVVLSWTESVIVEDDQETKKTGADIHNYEHNGRYYYPYINSGESEIADYLCITNYILNVSSVLWKKTDSLSSIFTDAGKYKLVGDWFSYLHVLQYGDVAYSPEPMNCYRFHEGTIRDTIKKENEYIETCEIHDLINQEHPAAMRNRRRQRRREELIGDIPRALRRKEIAWVTSLPLQGSGGHKTVFNHINALIEAGYDCDLFLMDVGYMTEQEAGRLVEERTVACAANIYTDLRKMKQHYDLVFATVWNSVPVAQKIRSSKTAYFIQDYEPWFFEPGSEYVKTAEGTYSKGLIPVTLGNWLAKKIESISGTPAVYFNFCTDTDIYYDMKLNRERSICAVYQPEKPRRYADMVCRVFEKIHETDPSIILYAFGSDQSDDRLKKAGVRELGVLPINQLNALYNRCTAGLCISLSNPSRIPFEMMASGLCVVDVNADNNQLDYPKDIVTLAEIDEQEIAMAIIDLVNDKSRNHRISQEGAALMKKYPLKKAYSQFIEIVRNLI